MQDIIPKYVIVQLSEETLIAIEAIKHICTRDANITIDIDAIVSVVLGSLTEDYNCNLYEQKFKELVNTITEPLLKYGLPDSFSDDLEIHLEVLHIEFYKTINQLGFYRSGRMNYEFDKFICADAIVVRHS